MTKDNLCETYALGICCVFDEVWRLISASSFFRRGDSYHEPSWRYAMSQIALSEASRSGRHSGRLNATICPVF